MKLQKLTLAQFKNYETLSLDFVGDIHCIVGDNGSGKTNLLDAIYYLSMSKSAFNSLDSQNIKFDETYFTIQGDFELDDAIENIFCGVQNGEKKILRRNKVQYERISEHIGKFPVVLIAPQDSLLISEGSEERRKFMDSIISQIDNQYLMELMQYNHLLKQRNSLLKLFAEKNYTDKDLLATYDSGILHFGKNIFERRKTFMNTFFPIFQKHYQDLSNQQEATDLAYESDFAESNFEANYKNSLPKDLALQRTTQGIHKDDFVFRINGNALKKFGSQGQQKSFLIALKLAHFESISHAKKIKPILLLDDIFDKLDEKRMNKLIRMVAEHTFGQIFVTDARPERTQKVFEAIQTEIQIITISNGSLV